MPKMPRVTMDTHEGCLRYDVVQALCQLARLVAYRFYLFLRDLLTLVNLFESRLCLFVKDARYVRCEASCCFTRTLIFLQNTGYQAMRICFFSKIHHISIYRSRLVGIHREFDLDILTYPLADNIGDWNIVREFGLCNAEEASRAWIN